MPIEIKELTIKIHVAEDGGDRPARPSGQGSNEIRKVRAEVMEDVMEVMKRLKER